MHREEDVLFQQQDQDHLLAFQEQLFALKLGMKSISQYMTASMEIPKNVTIIGDPGSGKTIVGLFQHCTWFELLLQCPVG